jgi:hypothetical protein
MNRPLLFLLVPILATAVGCSGGDRQVYANVKGTVKYNGKPIPKGTITFAVEGRPPTIMDIDNGDFSGQAMVGQNKIMVSAKKKGSAIAKLDAHAKAQIQGYMEHKFKAEPGQFGGPPKDYDPTMIDYIPPEWGTNSSQARVVEAGAANDFQFSIRGNN